MKVFDAHVHISEDKETVIRIARHLGIKAIVNIAYPALGRNTSDIEQYENSLFDDWQSREIKIFKVFTLPTRLLGSGYQKFVDKACSVINSKSSSEGFTGVKIWKDIGMRTKDREGEIVRLSDRRLNDVFRGIQDRGLVCVVHVADPIIAWQAEGGQVNYFKNNPEYFMYGRDSCPSHEELISDFEEVIQRWPRINFVAAHLLNLEHDFERLHLLLKSYSNLYLDTSAKNACIIRNHSSDFLRLIENFPERILYGSDWTVNMKLSDAKIFGYTTKYGEIICRLQQLLIRTACCNKYFMQNSLSLFGRQ